MNKIYALTGMFFLIVLSGCISYTANVSSSPALTPYSPKFKLESLRFYTAGEKGAEKEYRVYNTSFRIDAVDMMWYELIVSPLLESAGSVKLREVWYDDDNRILSSVTKEMNIASGEKYLEYSAGIRTGWVSGYYVLKLYQDSLEVANREFKIID